MFFKVLECAIKSSQTKCYKIYIKMADAYENIKKVLKGIFDAQIEFGRI